MILFNYRKTSNQIGAKKSSEQQQFSEEIQLNYLRKKVKDFYVDWKKLDYSEVDRIRKIIMSFGISKDAVKMGCKSLYRRINTNKIKSLLLIFLNNNKLGFSLYDLLGIAKHILKN